MSADFERTALVGFLLNRNPFLHNKVIELRMAVEAWLSYIPNTFPHYTSHTVHHSDEIVLQMSKLLFEDNDPGKPLVELSAMEVYVLVCSAYLHDVGMVVADKEKAEILDSEAWKEWTETGGGSQRWKEIQTFRHGESPANEGKRNFLADIQTRYLIAEFVRKSHHLLSVQLLVQRQSEFGGFGLQDPVLLRSISDVCAAHGLRQHELEDRDRYPERRDIQGDTVNVRFLAIVLRLGDLLDMSHDRACPLLLNAVCPLPPNSLAHWTKYQRLTHRFTSPDVIELTAECQNQEEHRFLQDWCKWIEDEVANARVLMLRGERHREWSLPKVRVDPEIGTIIIRPAGDATYIPSDWVFKLDQDEVFGRLVKDVYDHPSSYLRELIQNALDATRCQLYLDLKRDGLAIPDFPTQVDKGRRNQYPLRISLASIEVMNELSGQTEQRQLLTVEDCGMGMDRQIIRDYLLQVGRSYYKTEDFKRNFRFIPASRFGLGFLSVFAVSNQIALETYKPSSSAMDGPIRLTLTGPRNYLLLDKGNRRLAGTRIEVILDKLMEPKELTKHVKFWCPRVEFPILLDDLATKTTVTAERADEFVCEVPDVTQDAAKFVIRSFEVGRVGIEGELYVLAHVAKNGESWAVSSWARYTYPTLHPGAVAPTLPDSLACVHGVRVGSGLSYGYDSGAFASRLDYRGETFRLPVSRIRALGRLQREEGDRQVEGRWEEILSDHLATTDRAKGPDGWKYKQRLIHYFPFVVFWKNYPATIRVWINGSPCFLSLDELLHLPVIATVVHPKSPYYNLVYFGERPSTNPYPPVFSSRDAGISDDDLIALSDVHRKAIFESRHVESVRWLSSGHLAIDWRLGKQETGLLGDGGYGLAEFENLDVVGFCLHDTTGSSSHVLFNLSNAFIQWLLKINDACRRALYGLRIDQAERANALFKGAARYFGYGDDFDKLVAFIPKWRDMPDLPGELHPPLIKIGREMFRLLPHDKSTAHKPAIRK